MTATGALALQGEERRRRVKTGGLATDLLPVAYGKNRELSTCADCGHPTMAHLGGGCYCGCPRATKIAEPVVGDHPAPVHQLMDFMHGRLSKSECDRLIALIASAKGSALPIPRTHDSTRSFIRETLTPAETIRYVNELRRRLMTGEPLIQR